MVYLLYTFYISVDLAHHEIFHAKEGKGGMIEKTHLKISSILTSSLTFTFGQSIHASEDVQ